LAEAPQRHYRPARLRKDGAVKRRRRFARLI
jgi:hypothetical protein